MTATHVQNSTIPTVPVLYFSLELGSKNWKLAFTVGLGQKPRLRTIAAAGHRRPPAGRKGDISDIDVNQEEKGGRKGGPSRQNEQDPQQSVMSRFHLR